MHFPALRPRDYQVTKASDRRRSFIGGEISIDKRGMSYLPQSPTACITCIVLGGNASMVCHGFRTIGFLSKVRRTTEDGRAPMARDSGCPGRWLAVATSR